MRSTRRGSRRGLTLIEVLIALVFVSVTFVALAFAQLGNLRATARARILTDVKAAANAELEVRSANVLRSIREGQAGWDASFQDELDDGVGISFFFVDYARACVGGNATYARASGNYRTVANGYIEPCTNGTAAIVGASGARVTYSIQGVSGSAIEREGVITIVVTATAPDGSVNLTVGRTITCFDVYPTPTADTPVPCPVPS